ncbi:RING finger and SPRY domain-containing protein 1 [Mortierella sp. AM989]|nr:RING finger and SPRY domain-containing protein 1 [Mortierella sp. AM989]
MSCKVFSIIALEKFSLTGPCKARIMQTNIRQLLRGTANLSTHGMVDQEEISAILQAKFCAEWSLRNIFRDMPEEAEDSLLSDTAISQSQRQADRDISTLSQDSLLSKDSDGNAKTSESKPSNINVMLNTLDGTRHWKISEDGLTIRNDGTTFESIRATTSVSQGKWFYEVTLVTAGIMQLGWATVHCHFSPEDGTGVGDDIFGFAYDGCRNMIWADGESESYGGTESWKAGDVLGVYLDIDNAVMECFINGKGFGAISPFEKDYFAIQAKSGFFPALSCTSFQQATVNFGATPFNPLCRSRIFQRQMFQNNDSEDTTTSSGLGISGISSDASSANTSLPGLSASSTTTSNWSAEYCGPPPSSLPTSALSNSVQSSTDVPTATATATAAAAAVVAATVYNRSNSSESLTTRRRNTLAAPSPSSRIALEMDCLDDPFSPPSTAYFSFLNRPPRVQRSHLRHPMDIDSIDPLEHPVRRPHHSQPLPELQPLERSIGSENTGTTEMGGFGLGLGLGFNVDPNMASTDSPIDISDSDFEDSNGMDVVLVEEGREALDSEVMEHSAIDFPDGHSIHSRRSSIQVVSLPPIGPTSSSSTSSSIAAAAALNAALSNIGSVVSSSSNSIMSNASGLSHVASGSGIGMGTSRFNGRRASVPCNRLEM